MGFLAHPVPGGMRDLLPEEAEEQGRLSRQVLSTFRLHGYQPVLLPAFEYAQVLEQGLGGIEPTSILRFVEPETGEVVALRPDMTPQVARLVSTRLADMPPPIRLSYGGSVLRRRHERARHDQQIHQAGIELVGASGIQADLEVIRTVTTAVQGAGLRDFVLDLGHGALAGALLNDLTAEARAPLLESLSHKDGALVERRARHAGLDPKPARALSALVGLQGGLEIFDRARGVLEGTEAMGPLVELEQLARAVAEAGVATQLLIDLSETRAVAYYTGPMFQVLAEGPGQAVASGGRYDALYQQFGRSQPAAGGAIVVDHLRWALGGEVDGGHSPGPRVLVVVPERAAPEQNDVAEAALLRLRNAGLRSADLCSDSPIDYATAWRYSHLVRVARGGTLTASRVAAGGESDIGNCELDGLIGLLGA